MLYQILKKKTNGHNVTILYSPELERKNINKYICCYAVIDENIMVEAEFIPSSYPSCGDDFDEVNEHTGFRFKYKDKDVILTIDEIQEERFLYDRDHYYWLENKRKPFTLKLFTSLDGDRIVHFSFSELEAKQISNSYKEFLVTFEYEVEKEEVFNTINEYNNVDCKNDKDPFYIHTLYDLHDVCFCSEEHTENIIERDEEMEF